MDPYMMVQKPAVRCLYWHSHPRKDKQEYVCIIILMPTGNYFTYLIQVCICLQVSDFPVLLSTTSTGPWVKKEKGKLCSSDCFDFRILSDLGLVKTLALATLCAREISL